jgi:hypothetical protein
MPDGRRNVLERITGVRLTRGLRKVMLVLARYHILEMHIVGLVFYRIPPIKRRIFHRTWHLVQLVVERKGFPTLKQTSHGRSSWVELLVNTWQVTELVVTLVRLSEENSLEVRGIRMWVIQALRLQGQNGVVIWHQFVHKGRSLLVQLPQDKKRLSFSFTLLFHLNQSKLVALEHRRVSTLPEVSCKTWTTHKTTSRQ